MYIKGAHTYPFTLGLPLTVPLSSSFCALMGF